MERQTPFNQILDLELFKNRFLDKNRNLSKYIAASSLQVLYPDSTIKKKNNHTVKI